MYLLYSIIDQGNLAEWKNCERAGQPISVIRFSPTVFTWR